MNRYAFLRSPLWLVGVAIAVLAIVGFLSLGSWQLRRLDEVQTSNITIDERRSAEAIPLGLAVARYGEDPAALAHRRVVVEGRYDAPAEVLVVATTLNGRSGHDVLTPLRMEGPAMAVDRGWVPIDTEGPPVVGAEPPGGPVEVTGVLMPGETFGSLGTQGPSGAYEQIGRIDLDALSGQWGGDLFPLYLLLETQRPAGGELPVARPLEATSAGPHLSYAIQWFTFAAIVAVGFPALVVRTARGGGSV